MDFKLLVDTPEANQFDNLKFTALKDMQMVVGQIMLTNKQYLLVVKQEDSLLVNISVISKSAIKVLQSQKMAQCYSHSLHIIDLVQQLVATYLHYIVAKTLKL